MKRKGVTLVVIGALIGIGTGLLVAITSAIDLRTGKELAELGLVLGSSAVSVSVMYIILTVLTAKDRALTCGNLAIGTSLTTSVLGFGHIAYLVVSLPTEGEFEVYAGAIWLTSWFVALFLSTVLIGGVLIRLGATEQ